MQPAQNIQTKAFVVDHVGGPFMLKDVVLDSIHGDEVLVEILYTGLCHTVCISQTCPVDIAKMHQLTNSAGYCGQGRRHAYWRISSSTGP